MAAVSPNMCRRAKVMREARSWAFWIGLALVLRTFVVSAYHIPSESMQPTVLVGDRIFANRVIYALRAPKAGEVVVFDHPRDHGVDLIKRVVAVGGDRIEGRGGQVWVNGTPRGPSSDFAPLTVPKDNLFVMGDNRDHSSDSRIWGFVPIGLVKARAEVVWWSSGEGDGIRLRRLFHVIH